MEWATSTIEVVRVMVGGSVVLGGEGEVQVVMVMAGVKVVEYRRVYRNKSRRAGAVAAARGVPDLKLLSKMGKSLFVALGRDLQK